MPPDARTDDALIEQFATVTVWQQNGARAPHKPLLLLMMLARLQRGEPRLIGYQQLEAPLKKLLTDYGPQRRHGHQPEYPFWNLQRDSIWEVPERAALLTAIEGRKRQKDIPRAILHAHRAHGGLTEAIYARLQDDAQLVHRIAGRLLNDNFPATVHDEILDAVGMPWVVVTTRRRKRDPAFRNIVLRIYDYRCAVCGYDGRLGGKPLGIEAAHVMWHAAGGPDAPENGLALCSFHHRALDRGALGIDEHYRVAVSQDVHGGRAVEDWLLRFAGRPLAIPQSGQPRVEAGFVSWHRDQVFHHPARQ